MKHKEETRVFEFEHFDKYRLTYYFGSRVIKLEKMVRASWWKRFNDKIPMVYKTIYFGHSNPLDKVSEIVKEIEKNDN